MESSSYTCSTSTSSSPPEVKRCKPSHSLDTTLHAVRKHPTKLMKKPIAPLPPPPRPKIYKVEPRNFREAVQKLTGAPEYPLKRLQKLAPPPLNHLTIPASDIDDVAKQPQPQPLPAAINAHTREMMFQKTKEWDSFEEFSALGFTCSPSSQAWLSSLVLSPGTLSLESQSSHN